jgi:alpha-ribazole phosphatase
MGLARVSLWLARHARPLIASGICYGAMDLEADLQATQTAAQGLALALPSGIAVQVSPLRRCQQLADGLQALRGDLQLATDVRLREMDFGTWEGMAWADIPRSAIDAWTADFATHRFGGKESANDVLARVAAAWDALPKRGDTLWIAHSGVAQAASLLHQGVRHIAQAKDWPVTALGYGAWTLFPAAQPE